MWRVSRRTLWRRNSNHCSALKLTCCTSRLDRLPTHESSSVQSCESEMRRPAADYLEEAKIEDLAEDLSRDGYRVERGGSLGGQQFDIVAQRDGQIQVFEVKALSRLGE